MGKSPGFERGLQLFTVEGERGAGWRQVGIKKPQQCVGRKSDAFRVRQRETVFQPIALMAGFGYAVADRFGRERVSQFAES